MRRDLYDCHLGDHLTFRNGKASPDRHEKGSFPVFGSNGFLGNSDETNAGSGTIIIGRVGSYCGSVHYSGSPCWVSDNAIICEAKSYTESLFWFYFLKSSDLNNYRSGSGQPLLNQATLKGLPCRIPVMPSNRVDIGTALERYDKKIETNSAINQTLEKIAQALFKSWFVDFDPVKAKAAALEAGGTADEAERAAMQAISGKSEAELDSLKTENPDQYDSLARTAVLFPSAMVESELGEIPEGWKVTQLGSIAENVRNSIKPSDMSPDTLYVGLEHIDRKSLALTRGGSAREVESNKSFFKKGDVLFGKLRPYFHKVCVAPEQGVCSTDILVIRPSREHLVSFVTFLCFLEGFVNYTNLHSSGTRMPRASWKDMSKYSLVYPSEALLERFEETVNPMRESQIQRVYESKTLAELRNGLLPKLMSGELVVRGTEEVTVEKLEA